MHRIERAFQQLHRLLCLIERGATQDEVERAERSYQRSIKKLEVSERDLLRNYPKYRFAILARQAAAQAHIEPTVAIPAEELS